MKRTVASLASDAAAPPLVGRVVVVTGETRRVGGRVAAALAALGVTVGVVEPEPSLSEDAIHAVDGSVASRGDATETFTSVAEVLGPIDAIVHAAGVEPLLEDRLLVDTGDADWDRGAEAPIRAALAVLQGAFATMGERGGSVVAGLPSIALTGAPGLTAFASAAEGIRLLVKSAARQWGPHGIRVNSVALPIAEWAVTQPPEHILPSKFGPSLAETDLMSDVAGAVAFLAADLSRGVTGATMVVDRGTLMVP